MSDIEVTNIIDSEKAKEEFVDMNLSAKLLHDPENDGENNTHCVIVGENAIVFESIE